MPGGRARVDGQVADIDALGAQATDDGDAEPVAPDATDVRDRLAEPGEPDRDVRLGAGDVALEGGGLGERARLLGDERDQALPEGHDRGGHRGTPGVRGAAAAGTSVRDDLDDLSRPRRHAGRLAVADQPAAQADGEAPAAMNAPAFSAVTPPVGTSGMSGNGPRSSRTKDGPSDEAGKTLMAAAPARHAARTSVGVAAPGNAGMPRSAAQATSSGSVWGITRNVAPASTAALRRLDRQHRPGADRQTRAPSRPRSPRRGDGLDRAQRVGLRLVEGDLEGADAARRRAPRATRGADSGGQPSRDGDHATLDQAGRDRRACRRRSSRRTA